MVADSYEVKVQSIVQYTPFQTFKRLQLLNKTKRMSYNNRSSKFVVLDYCLFCLIAHCHQNFQIFIKLA